MYILKDRTRRKTNVANKSKQIDSTITMLKRKYIEREEKNGKVWRGILKICD